METPEYKIFRLTTADAKKMIAGAPRGTQFVLHVSCDLPIGDTGKVFPQAGGGYVDLSRKVALRVVEQLVSKALEERGALVPLAVMGKNYWIG